MYRNRQCNCSCECNQVDAIEDIQRSICKIKAGIKDIQNGLNDICCCRISEGIKCIENGLCKAKKGLYDVIEGLKDFEFECDYRSNTGIKDGVCGIKDGVKGVQEGLCDLQNGCLCEGIVNVREGLQDLEEGLCNLIKGVSDINDEREKRRKNKGCEICPGTACENRYDEICGCFGTDYKI